MASYPPSQCCTVGVKHDGAVSGKLEMIAGTETYVATPIKPKDKTAILLITDVKYVAWFHIMDKAWEFPSLIADQYASNGYFTIIPDMFHGDPVPDNPPEGFDLGKWLKGKEGGGEGEGHMVSRVEPIVKAAIKWLRDERGCTLVGGVGYCFGAKYVVRSMEKGGGIDVGYVAHPSFVDDDELAQISGPFSIAAAETDTIFPAEKRHASEEILKETGQPWQINLFSGAEHGFAVRGDPNKPQAKYAKEQAFIQAIQWFDQWLK